MRKLGLLIFFCTLVTASLFPKGIRDEMNGNEPAPVTGKTMHISGRVVIYGSEPHTFAGIAAENGTEYAVYSPDHDAEIRQLQGHIIEFTVILLDEPQGLGGLQLKGGTVTPLNWEIIR